MNANKILMALAGSAMGGGRGGAMGGGLVGGGGLAGGLLGGLLGRRRRRFGRSSMAMSGLAAIAGIAYRAWQAQSEKKQAAAGRRPSEDELRQAGFVTAPGDGGGGDPALLVVESMIYAARADGEVDAGEREAIRQQMKDGDFDAGERAFLEEALERRIDLNAFAGRVGSPQLAMEVYAAAYAVVDPPSTAERAHLDMLGSRLGLSEETARAIEAEVDAAADAEEAAAG